MNRSPALLSSSQQLHQQNLLHANIRQSTGVLQSWQGDADAMASSSSALVKACKQLNTTFVSRIKTERLDQNKVLAGQQALGDLLKASKHVNELASCLKIALKAIIKTYQNDLNRMDRGRKPSNLVQVPQENGTFQRQVRHAERLLRQVLSAEQAPSCVDLTPIFAEPTVKLNRALWNVQSRVQGLTGGDLAKVNGHFNELKNQAVALHRKVATPEISARVGTLNQDSRNQTRQQRAEQLSWPPANIEPWH